MTVASGRNCFSGSRMIHGQRLRLSKSGSVQVISGCSGDVLCAITSGRRLASRDGRLTKVSPPCSRDPIKFMLSSFHPLITICVSLFRGKSSDSISKPLRFLPAPKAINARDQSVACNWPPYKHAFPELSGVLFYPSSKKEKHAKLSELHVKLFEHQNLPLYAVWRDS